MLLSIIMFQIKIRCVFHLLDFVFFIILNFCSSYFYLKLLLVKLLSQNIITISKEVNYILNNLEGILKILLFIIKISLYII